MLNDPNADRVLEALQRVFLEGGPIGGLGKLLALIPANAPEVFSPTALSNLSCGGLPLNGLPERWRYSHRVMPVLTVSCPAPTALRLRTVFCPCVLLLGILLFTSHPSAECIVIGVLRTTYQVAP